MSRDILAGQATATKRRVFFHCVDATDGLTPETGEDGGQPQISVDGAGWTSTGIGTLVAIGNGRYYAELTQDICVVGTTIETRYKSANTAESVGDQARIVAYDPDLATPPANVTQWDGHAVLAHTVEGAPVVTVKVGTGAATGEINTANGVVPASVSGGATSTDVSNATTAINSHTDSAVAAIDTPAEIAAGVRSNLATELARIDVAISTRTAQPTGARQITLQVRDGSGNGVDAVDVAIYDSTNTTHLWTVTTDVAGNVVFNINDNTYKLRPVKVGCTFTTPQTMTVTADATVSVTASVFAPSTPVSATVCTVYFYTLDGENTPTSGVVVDFYPDAPLGVGNGVLLSSKVSVTSGPSVTHPSWPAGYAEIGLIKTATYRTASRLPKLDGLVITVPSTTPSMLAALVEAAKA